jgi:hypothetical protein
VKDGHTLLEKGHMIITNTRRAALITKEAFIGGALRPQPFLHQKSSLDIVKLRV